MDRIGPNTGVVPPLNGRVGAGAVVHDVTDKMSLSHNGVPLSP